MDTHGSIILVSPDDPATCPHCARRLETPLENGRFVEFSADIDGPIYAGECPEHGQTLWQVFEEPDENEFRR